MFHRTKADEKLCEEAYIEHYETVYYLCLDILHNRTEAWDATQETYLRVWENLHMLRDKSKMRGWILVTARHVATDILKKSLKINMVSLDAVPEGVDSGNYLLPSNEFNPEHMFEVKAGIETVNDILKEMDDAYSDLLYLKIYCEMSISEIAHHLKMNYNTVKSRIYRGLNMLRERLRKLQEDDIGGNNEEE